MYLEHFTHLPQKSHVIKCSYILERHGNGNKLSFLLFKVFAILRNIILPKHLIVVAKKILKLATLKLEVSKDL